jgi:hypothetical protein
MLYSEAVARYHEDHNKSKAEIRHSEKLQALGGGWGRLGAEHKAPVISVSERHRSLLETATVEARA